MREIGYVLLLPLLGTALGAAGVFVMGRKATPGVERGLNGFAAGVMVAASVWSLILPALEQSEAMGQLSFLPATVGIWLGFAFVEFLSRMIPGGASLTATAVALHNLPEGMAVGIAAAGVLSGTVSFPAYFALSAGIAIQNLPEGAIISLPLRAEGRSRRRAFGAGVLSGVIEPVGAVLTLLLAALAAPVMPWLLAFSAGAMLHVAATELIPGMASRLGTGCYMIGFTLMMALDVALG
jgi:ZIP family zinc transporter